MTDDNLFNEDDVIFSYTRKQAIEDGVLIDLTPWAKETGFKIPVACTATVWHEWITPSEATESFGQSERGRAHDVLWMCYVAIKSARSGGDQLQFDVLFLGSDQRQHTVTLKAVCGPGDEGEPVLTIMLPHED